MVGFSFPNQVCCLISLWVLRNSLFLENVKKERVIEFSFSVQSLMISSRLLVLMLRDEVLDEPTSWGWFLVFFGNFIFSLDTNARAFPVL